jgi:hypothetical protein
MTTTIVIAAIVLIVGTARIVWVSRKRVALEGDIAQAIVELFGNSSERPEVRVTSAYGYPRFDVIFSSTQLLNSARNDGTTAALLARIQSRCEGMGPQRQRFDAAAGVSFSVRQ